MKSSKLAGFILIIIGALILLHKQNIDIFQWYYIRGFGLLLIGLFFLSRGISHPQKRGIYLGTFLLLTGVYFSLEILEILEISRGLTISVLTIILGTSFYSLYIFKSRDWGYLLYGNLVILLGLFFLLEHLRILPRELLVYGVDRYWPIIFILIGLIIIINGYSKNKRIDGSSE